MNFLEKNYYELVKKEVWKLSQITNVTMRDNVRKELKTNGIYKEYME